MKSLLISIFLLSLCLPNIISAGCSFFEPVDDFNATKAAKIWYAVRRYENGREANTTCEILDISKVEYGSKTLYNADGTSRKITGNIPIDPKCNTGNRIIKNVTPGNPSKLIVTYIDYDNIMVTRSCFNDIEYLWIYSTKKRPCKPTRDAIEAIIKEQKLDTKPIFKMCKCDIKNI